MLCVSTIRITDDKSITVNYDDNTTYGELRKSIDEIFQEKLFLVMEFNRLQLDDKISPILNKKNSFLNLIISRK